MKRRPGQKIKLTSVEELLGVNNEESAIDIEIVKIRSFRNHPRPGGIPSGRWTADADQDHLCCKKAPEQTALDWRHPDHDG